MGGHILAEIWPIFEEVPPTNPCLVQLSVGQTRFVEGDPTDHQPTWRLPSSVALLALSELVPWKNASSETCTSVDYGSGAAYPRAEAELSSNIPISSLKKELDSPNAASSATTWRCRKWEREIVAGHVTM